MDKKYWIGVASKNHVEKGVTGGFCQLCHGKTTPLKKMRKGDGIIYYSPRTEMKSGESLQSFTAIGTITGEKPYQFEMSPDFSPFRLNVEYEDAKPVKISLILKELKFVQSLKNTSKWGMLFRRGHFEISKDDFELIHSKMRVNITN